MAKHLLSVGEVVERPALVNDAHGGLLRSDTDALNIVARFTQYFQLVVKNVRSLDSSLGMKLRRIRDLEEHVLHDVARIRHLEFERLVL